MSKYESKRWLLALAAAAAAMVLIVRFTAAGTTPVVAKAGNIVLDEQDVRAAIALLPDAARSNLRANGSLLANLVRSELIERAILKEARQQGFDAEPLTREHIDQAARKALASMWIAKKGTPPASYPDESQIRRAYDVALREPPLEYHLLQIFVRAPDSAPPASVAAAIAKVARISARIATADFAQLARADSDDPDTASKGGDEGFVPAEQLIPGVAAAVKSLAPGEIAGPIKSSAGFHFLKLIGTRTVPAPPLDSVRARLVSELRAREQKSLQDLYLRELTDRLDIEIDRAALEKVQASL
jgi:parvulin-like peptidyl-prolyl isomerase